MYGPTRFLILISNIKGYEGRNAVAEAMGVQAGSHADSVQNVYSQPP